MKKIILNILLLVVVASCGKDETVYLYSKYDKQYEQLKTYVTQKCQNDSKIFKALDKANSVDNWRKKFVGNIFAT